MTSKAGVFVVLVRYHFKNNSTGQYEITEVCHILDKVNKKMQQEASVIIDFENKTLIKNRDIEVSLHEYIEYLKLRYKKQYDQLNDHLGIVEEESEGVDDTGFVGETTIETEVEPSTVENTDESSDSQV